MMTLFRYCLAGALTIGFLPAIGAQTPTGSDTNSQDRKPGAQAGEAPSGYQGNVPIYRVQVVSRTVAAVSYRNRSGWTKVDFQGTALAPTAKGMAEVNSRPGYLEVKTTMKGLQPASRYGGEYLTYVLWAITPDGRSTNLGEVLVGNDGDAKLDVTTELQAFGLIVTAEPFFAVSEPSDVVVMENVVRKDTVGKIEEVDAKYELLRRGEYVAHGTPKEMQPAARDPKVPLELYEARNAIQLARAAKADQYGDTTFQDAEKLLQQAEEYQNRKAGRKPVVMTAREAVQRAEDSRLISIKRQRQMELEHERQVAAERQAKARAEAEEAARQQQEAEAQAKREEERRAQAEQQRLLAERAKADADLARQQAAAEAERAHQAASQAEAEKNALRQQLLQQFNAVLDTRETPRGLVVNMSDVLFDTGKYTLRPALREKLARLSGIVVSHPGLNLQVEGHTDSVGGDAYNMKLSQQRADTVRDYLVQSGVNPQSITATGVGKADPIASNDTPAGRQQNRRVEMIVSGEVIGMKIGVPAGANPGAPTPAAPSGEPPAAPTGAQAPTAPGPSPAPATGSTPAAPPQ